MAGAVPAGGSGADRLGEVLEEGLDAEHPGAVLEGRAARMVDAPVVAHVRHAEDVAQPEHRRGLQAALAVGVADRSDEHTSDLQSLKRIKYAVFCLKKNTIFLIIQKQLKT